jgi:F0F1-type ATP synthase membrane subunit b/b'
MDIKDFRKFVNDSPIKDKLNNLKIVLNYPHLESKLELDGIQSIYKFIHDQVIGWNHIENIPDYLSHSKRHFETLKGRIIGLTEYFKENYQNQFDNQWNQLISEIQNPRFQNQYYVFLIDSPETDFLFKVNTKSVNHTQGAIDYITDVAINFNNGIYYFTGVLFAYEFKNQKESEILQRRNNEKISLGQIREKYNNYIVEAEQQLNGNLSDAKENLTSHFETVDKLKEEKNKNFEEWFKSTEEGFDDFYSKAQESIKVNEDLYREKLRLEAPAKYWKDRAILLKSEGDKYLNWLIKTSVIAAILLFILLMTLGTDFYETAFNDRIKGIKWSIILITIVSLLAFTIKILSKMTFSSFHLSRDAEEREQLTHFYLALKKDTAIEPEERQLILQSLFSRADTGLLKDDSSPTMPTSIIEKFAGGR